MRNGGLLEDMKTKTEIENLAVSFRMNSPNLRHCETWDSLATVGGDAAILYGFFMATPEHSRKKRAGIAHSIATALDRYAAQMGGVK